MRRTGPVLLVMLVALLAVASAGAAPPTWLAPTQLSKLGMKEDARGNEVAMGPRGDLADVWELEKSSGANRVEVAIRRPGGSWGAPVAVSPLGANSSGAEIGIAEAGDVTVVWSQEAGEGVNVLYSSTLSPGLQWSAPVAVSAAGDKPGWFELAVDPGGEAVIVYEDSSTVKSRARVVTRPAGGDWAAPLTVSAAGEETTTNPTLAVGAGGDAAIVWTIPNAVRAVERPAGGGWSAPATVVSASNSFFYPSVAVAPNGEAVAVWQQAINGVGAVVESSFETGGAWSAPVELGGGFFYAGPPQVAIDAAGEAVALWERKIENPASFDVLAASRPRGGPWSTPTAVPRTEKEEPYEPSLALSPGGQAVAAWVTGTLTEHIIRTSVRPAGAPWGPPTDLTKPTESVDNPIVAADAHGNAVVVWGAGGFEANIVAAGLDGAGPELRSLSIPSTGATKASLSFAVDAVDVWSGVSTRWSFGDGSTADGPNAGHAYATPGLYSVGLTATDSLGNAVSGSGATTVALAPVPRGTARGSRTAIVRKGKASLTLACASAQCTGLAELLAKPPAPSAKARAKKKGKKRRLTLAGKSRFSIAPGKHAVVKVALRAPILVRLKGSANHQLKVRLAGEGVAPGPVTLRLAPPHRRSHHR
jgi:hypothetical protein